MVKELEIKCEIKGVMNTPNILGFVTRTMVLPVTDMEKEAGGWGKSGMKI